MLSHNFLILDVYDHCIVFEASFNGQKAMVGNWYLDRQYRRNITP